VNSHAPPKRKGRLCGPALRGLRLRGSYRRFRFPQGKFRRCVCCSRSVSNKTLGGFDGRSGLSGELFCLTCADSAPPTFLAIARLGCVTQLVFSFGGI
jgi:hypothetical protein